MFNTIDAGKTWDKFDYPGKYVAALAFSPGDSKTIFAGTDSGLFQSSDGGSTWTQLNQYKGIAVMALASDADGNLYVSTPKFGPAKSSDHFDSCRFAEQDNLCRQICRASGVSGSI